MFFFSIWMHYLGLLRCDKSSRTRPPAPTHTTRSSLPSTFAFPHNLFLLFLFFFSPRPPSPRLPHHTHTHTNISGTSVRSPSLIHTSFFFPLLCRRLRQAALIRQRGHSPGSLIGRLRGRLARYLTRGGGSCRNQTGGGGGGRERGREGEQRLSARAAFSESV